MAGEVSRICGIRIDYFVTAIVGIGGSLFGYDIGIISGVLDMDHFKNKFNFDSWQKGVIVTSFVVGNFLGALAANFVTDRYGRRQALAGGCLVFLVGAALQCSAETLGVLYAGRIVAGLAIGVLCATVSRSRHSARLTAGFRSRCLIQSSRLLRYAGG